MESKWPGEAPFREAAAEGSVCPLQQLGEVSTQRGAEALCSHRCLCMYPRGSPFQPLAMNPFPSVLSAAGYFFIPLSAGAHCNLVPLWVRFLLVLSSFFALMNPNPVKCSMWGESQKQLRRNTAFTCDKYHSLDYQEEFSCLWVWWFSRSPCFFSILDEIWFICSSVKGFTNMLLGATFFLGENHSLRQEKQSLQAIISRLRGREVGQWFPFWLLV